MSKYEAPMELAPETIPGKLMERIHVGMDVLELGCASGRMTRYMDEQKGCRVFIVELNPDDYTLALPYAAGGFCGDLEGHEWLNAVGERRFDRIILADVLEHLRNPEQVLSQAAALLKEGGEVLISLPNIAHYDVIANLIQNRFAYTELGLLDNTHVHFWGLSDVKPLLVRCGLFLTVLDAVYVMPGRTEQNPSADGLSPVLQAALLRTPHRLVYQYFIVAKKAQRAKEKGVYLENRLQLREGSGRARFFLDTGVGYQADQWRWVQPEVFEDGISSHFHLSNLPVGCKAVRYDPAEGCGCLVKDLSATSDGGNCSVTPLNGTALEEIMVFTCPDPQIEIGIPEGALWVDVICATYPVEQRDWMRLLSLANEQVTLVAVLAEENTALTAQQTLAQAQAVEQREALEQARAQVVEQQEALAQAQTQAVEQQEALEQAHTQAVEQQEALEQARTQAAAQQEALVQARTQAAAQQKALVQAQTQTAAQQEALEQARSQATEQQLALEQAQSQVAEQQRTLQQVQKNEVLLRARAEEDSLKLDAQGEHLAWCRANAAEVERALQQTREESQRLYLCVEQLRAQCAQEQERYYAISRSQCWNLTAPLRVVLDWIKATTLGALVHKTMRALKNVGVAGTVQKARAYLSGHGVDTMQTPVITQIDTFGGFLAAIEHLGGRVFGTEFFPEQSERNEARCVLLVSHTLNRTGAPTALVHFADELKHNNYSPVVIAPSDDVLRAELVEHEIPVCIYERLYQSNLVQRSANLFDLIVVNTTVGAPIISSMNGEKAPVLWWIHEAHASYHPAAIVAMPDTLADNIHVYCGGSYAEMVLKQYRPDYRCRQLLYYVPDYAKALPSGNAFVLARAEGKLVFAIVGMQEHRKGQDILVNAIRVLSPQQRAQCLFVFVGRAYYQPIQEEIYRICTDYPLQVQFIEELDREALTAFYQQIDCLICASRDDPMPIVVTEAMLFSKVVICSENAGSAQILEKMNSGIIYRNNDPVELATCIEYVLCNANNWEPMCQRARLTYERFFSIDAFGAATKDLLMEHCQKKTEVLTYEGTVSVIIPTFNAGDELLKLLESLNQQTNVAHVEVVVIDSGSRDGTAERAEELGARVLRISQAEFSHSYARNLGAQHAGGSYLLFMTQDAQPTSTAWISGLLQPALRNGVVAASCRETPKQDCDLLGRVSIWLHSDYMGVLQSDRILTLPAHANYDSLRRNGQLNDVTCLIRKDVFLEFGYRGDYAEDLDLGIRLIQAGHKLALLSTVQVVHSHTRPAIYHLKRAIVDSLTLKKILPDLPVALLTSEMMACRIVTAYYATTRLADYLKATVEGVETVEGFCHRVEGEFGAMVAQLNQLNPQKLIAQVTVPCPLFGDEMAQFVRRILSLCPEKIVCAPEMVGDQVYYITHILPRYWVAMGESVTPQCKEEILTLLPKHFAQIAGGMLAACAHRENPAVEAILTEYSVGV